MSDPSTALETLRQLQRSGRGEELQHYLHQHPELAFSDEPGLLVAMALGHRILNQSNEAQAIQSQIHAEAIPSDPEALADYGLLLFLSGDHTSGLAALEQAGRQASPPAIVYQRLGGMYMAGERLEEAAEAFEHSLKLEPDRAEILSNIGGLKFRQGDLDQSLQFYEKAIALRSELAHGPTGQQREKVLVQLGRVDDLIHEKEQQLADNPELPSHHLQLANALIQAERLAEAQATLEAALDRFPDERFVRLGLINFYFRQKQWWKAGQLLKEWSEAEPDNMEYRLLLNQARLELNFFDAARADLAAIADDAAGLPRYALLQAKLLIDESKAEEARQLLEEASSRFPGDVEIKSQLAEVLTSLGRLQEAEELVEAMGLNNAMGLARRLEAAGCKASEEETEALKKLAAQPQLDPIQRSSMLFTLARVLEKQKNYPASFEAAHEANELMRPQIGYQWQEHRLLIEKLLRSFRPSVVQHLAGHGHPSRRPIFVTGMPRSGTTLTEQILCSHPQVYGAGELPWIAKLSNLMQQAAPGHPYPDAISYIEPHHIKAAGQYYLDKISIQNDDADFVVDKMPHNFDHIGLIALAFPNAAIIHLKREDRDVALSNYYQNFTAAHGLMGFAYSLEDIGHMLNDHRRIMEHWHELFPGRIFELDYQQLVNEPEPTIRSLLKHCGLTWDPQVLKFYETSRPVRTASIRQVREGIYTSSAEKWRRYEGCLDPLEAVLAEGFKPLEQHRSDELGAAMFAAGPTR